MSELRPIVRSSGRPVVLLLVALGCGCAPRPAVVDAVSGAPVAAEVRELADGRLLVSANGYETWSGARQERVALMPLWQARFVGESVRPVLPPRPPCPGCPSTRAR
jgi:hypothetical protein